VRTPLGSSEFGLSGLVLDVERWRMHTTFRVAATRAAVAVGIAVAGHAQRGPGARLRGADDAV
jgi:hypothetical protein